MKNKNSDIDKIEKCIDRLNTCNEDYIVNDAQSNLKFALKALQEKEAIIKSLRDKLGKITDEGFNEDFPKTNLDIDEYELIKNREEWGIPMKYLMILFLFY